MDGGVALCFTTVPIPSHPREDVGRTCRYDLAYVERPLPVALETLSPRELRAITEAAAWYAKYHERMIAEHADDESAVAVARREQFEHLHTGLGKLGIRLRWPAGLAAQS